MDEPTPIMPAPDEVFSGSKALHGKKKPIEKKMPKSVGNPCSDLVCVSFCSCCIFYILCVCIKIH